MMRTMKSSQDASLALVTVLAFTRIRLKRYQALFQEALEDYVETCAKVDKEPQKAFG